MKAITAGFFLFLLLTCGFAIELTPASMSSLVLGSSMQYVLVISNPSDTSYVCTFSHTNPAILMEFPDGQTVTVPKGGLTVDVEMTVSNLPADDTVTVSCVDGLGRVQTLEQQLDLVGLPAVLVPETTTTMPITTTTRPPNIPPEIIIPPNLRFPDNNLNTQTSVPQTTTSSTTTSENAVPQTTIPQTATTVAATTAPNTEAQVANIPISGTPEADLPKPNVFNVIEYATIGLLGVGTIVLVILLLKP